MEESKYTIYIHRNKINNKVYIGQTRLSPWYRRFRGGSAYKENPYFYNEIKKYGWENFTHSILEKNLTSQQADEREKYWINYFESCNPEFGYNMRKGGKGDYPKRLNKTRNKKSVVCVETSQIFESLSAAAVWGGLSKDSASNIKANIMGSKPSAGKHPETGQPLHWKWSLEDEDPDIKDRSAHNAIGVKNIDTNEIFTSIAKATEAYDTYYLAIKKSCESIGEKTAGGYHWLFMN